MYFELKDSSIQFWNLYVVNGIKKANDCLIISPMRWENSQFTRPYRVGVFKVMVASKIYVPPYAEVGG